MRLFLKKMFYITISLMLILLIIFIFKFWFGFDNNFNWNHILIFNCNYKKNISFNLPFLFLSFFEKHENIYDITNVDIYVNFEIMKINWKTNFDCRLNCDWNWNQIGFINFFSFYFFIFEMITIAIGIVMGYGFVFLNKWNF